jgi:hypothetical protein
MNLNKKIEKVKGDGIPFYNDKINDLIDAVNWLAGIRTINGKNIRESDQGPVLDLSSVNSTQTAGTPWANDPDGNQAGWTKITGFDFSGNITGTANSLFDFWSWTGAKALNVRPIPWAFDPSGSQAGWIVCPSNSFWGTGQCSGTGTTCTNYQNCGYTGSDQGTSPLILHFHATNPPIVIPSSCTPRFILVADPPQGSTGGGAGPSLGIVNGLTSAMGSDTLTWKLSIDYDGVSFYSASGSDLVQYNVTLWKTLNPAGWLFDPSGIPGYAHGSGLWVYPFNGTVSQNTNPIITETFTFSYASSGETLASFVFVVKAVTGVSFMTG